MRRQSVMLTLWLLLPFGAMAALMTWIFVSLDKDKLMADAPPVGAGAGDTGNANALGQFLAGRDPDLIDHALAARRSQSAIDPRDWPGGLLVRLDPKLLGEAPGSPLLIARSKDGARIETETLRLKDGWFTARLNHNQVLGADLWIASGPVRLVRGELIAEPGESVVGLPMSTQIPGLELQASDPMVLEFGGSESTSGGTP